MCTREGHALADLTVKARSLCMRGTRSTQHITGCSMIPALHKDLTATLGSATRIRY